MPEGIACWFIDTDYNEESFFVRHAYFLGANDPYKSLKITLKAEINEDAWATLNSDTSRPFDKPRSGRIAVKVINHLGDEVMKVFPGCAREGRRMMKQTIQYTSPLDALVTVAKRLSLYENQQHMDSETFFGQYSRGQLSRRYLVCGVGE